LQQSAIWHCLGIPVFGNHVLNDQDWHQQVSDYKQTSRPPTTKPLVWIWRQASVVQRSHSNSYGWRHAHGWLITIVVKLLIHFSLIVCISFSFHSQSIVSILFTEATISAIRVSNAYSILRDLRELCCRQMSVRPSVCVRDVTIRCYVKTRKYTGICERGSVM